MGKFREGMRLEYRLESFNAFNHPQFCGPGTTYIDPSLGVDPQDNPFGKIYCTVNAARQLQMALKLYF